MTEARKDRRAPASIKVKYKSASMIEFIELLGGDVSRGGIFIRTKKPLEPGALLKFEFQLQNGEPMISGVGRVAWRRTEEGARPTLPAGMGIKFIKLNDQSRIVIDRIEAKHGPGSRYDQTDNAEIATSMSSLPPSASGATFGAVTVSQPPDTEGTLVTPLRPDASRAAAEADAAASPRLRPSSANLNTPGSYSLTDSGRPTRSSPPLREAKTSGPKPAAAAMAATFRPPPPATDSVPPTHSFASPVPPANAVAPRSSPLPPNARATTRTAFTRSSSGAFASPVLAAPAAGSSAPVAAASGASGSPSGSAPRGVLGSGAPAAARRAGAVPSSRTAARDASEFLASAFAVGGAGREVRSEARAQVERARHDPHSVDLANELFGDLSEPATKADANAALDADPILSERALNSETATEANTAETRRPPQDSEQPDLTAAAAANDVGARISQRLRTTPRPAANDQLKLALAATTERPGAGGKRSLWFAVIAIVGVGVGAGVFYLQRAAPEAAPPAPPELVAPVQAPPPSAAAIEPPPPAAVSVDWALSSEPEGAALAVDGVASGTTPTTLKLTSGKSIQISLRSPGYLTKNESVEVVPDMPARTITLEHIPYELVVKEPIGATIKAMDKSGESPAPLNLGVPFPGPTALGEITVSIEKPGFKPATRKLTRSDFKEVDGVLRSELSLMLAPLPAAKAAAKASVVKVTPAPAAPAAAEIAAAPPEPQQAPPEPEAAQAAPKEPPAAPAPAPTEAKKEADKPAEPAPAPAPASGLQPQTLAPAPAAPPPAPPAEPAAPAEP